MHGHGFVLPILLGLLGIILPYFPALDHSNFSSKAAREFMATFFDALSQQLAILKLVCLQLLSLFWALL